MNTQRIFGIFLRQVYVIRNLPSRIVPYFLWAALEIVLWGFITTYLNTLGNATFSFVPTLLGAVVLWEFLHRVQQGVIIPFLEDVWSRNFFNMFASPISVGEYLSGLTVTSLVTSFLGLGAMAILARLVFGLSLFSFGVPLIFFALSLLTFGIALGIVGNAIVLRLGPYAEWFVWPIPAIISPFVGVFYPIAVLPPWMQYIGWLLPPSYVFEGMRGMLIERTVSYALLSWSVILSCVSLALAYGLFVWTYRIVVRRGLLARFSVEGG